MKYVLAGEMLAIGPFNSKNEARDYAKNHTLVPNVIALLPKSDDKADVIDPSLSIHDTDEFLGVDEFLDDEGTAGNITLTLSHDDAALISRGLYHWDGWTGCGTISEYDDMRRRDLITAIDNKLNNNNTTEETS